MNPTQNFQFVRLLVIIPVIMLIVLTVPALSFAPVEPAEQVIQFPKDKSLGTLSVREKDAPLPDKETMMMSLTSQRTYISPEFRKERLLWRRFAEARGAVVVPAHKDILLEMKDPSADLAALSHLRPGDLQGIIVDYPFTQDISPHIKHLASLKVLDLSSSELDDAGLARLGKLYSLELLDIGDTAVSDAGLGHLKAFPALKVLDVGETKITDAGLAHLKGLQSLEFLGLAHTQITDAGLAEISSLTSLKLLMLAETAITSSGLAHLKDMQSLEYLQVANTNITNTALPHLKQLRSLKDVHMTRTGMTDAAAAELYDAIPGITVLFDWMEPLFGKIFLCFFIAAPVIFLFLPLLNKKMQSGASVRIGLFLLSCIAGLLIWFVPVILPEIRSYRAGNPFGWYGAYTQALVLGILFGIAIYLQAHLADLHYQRKQTTPVYLLFIPLSACLFFWIIFRPPLPIFLFIPLPQLAPLSLAFLMVPLPPVALIIGGVNYYHAAKRCQK